jgi:hypothetical protein
MQSVPLVKCLLSANRTSSFPDVSPAWGGMGAKDGLSRHIDKYAFLRPGDTGLWARGGKSAQAEAVSGEDCGDDAEHQKVSGGVGPEQSLGAELTEALAFEPDHGGDGNVGGGEEDAKPGAGIAVVRPDDVQYKRDKPSVT